MFIYESVKLNDVYEDSKKQKFNSNNHWINIPPNNYEEILALTNTCNWIDLFHKKYDKIVINKASEIYFLKEAYKIGKITGQFPISFKEELEIFVEKYKHIKLDNNFIRTENVSLKEGQYGIGPYNNIENVVKSLVTCNTTHTPINDNTKNITLYILPWVKIKEEFRVFVYNNSITCISQQHCYKNSNLNEPNLEFYGNIIIEYFKSHIKNKFKLDSYTFDFAILENNKPYFIEFNSFGKEYAAGSSLFHWLLDEKKLYGKIINKIYFRYK